MDEPLLPKTPEESLRSPPLFPTGFIDLGPSWRSPDAIIPILASPNSSSFANLIANINNRRLAHRSHSHSAPSVFTDVREPYTDASHPVPTLKKTPSIVRQAFYGLILYVAIGVIVYVPTSSEFTGTDTFKPVDGLYFTIVTLCTIGYGDIVPDSTFTKLFTSIFILVGFGLIDLLLNGLVTYVLDRQEAVLLSAVDQHRFNSMVEFYMMDTEKGRMRIRMKVFLALAAVFGCIAVGTLTVHFLEKMSWVDSFYLSVTSVTTVGYGDYGFETLTGRCFAIVWLLVSTLAVARAFLYLTELRVDKRNRKIAKWVLQRKLTVGDLVAADLDHNGYISKSEYVIYKLKEMGKITEKDVQLISQQFDRLDNHNNGKITVADLMDGD